MLKNPRTGREIAAGWGYTRGVAKNTNPGVDGGGERREPLVPVTRPLVAELLRPVFGPCTPVSVEPLTAGRVNTNYRVQVAGSSQPIVLRIYTRRADVCAREAALFRLVRDWVLVPELLWADSSGSSYERPYAVMTFVEGVPLTAGLRDAPAAIGRAVGETLAAIGTHTFPQAGFFRPDLAARDRPEGQRLPFLEHAERCLDGGAAARLGDPLADEVRAFLRRHAAYLPAEPRPAALVHGDYHEGNLLLRRADDRWRVVAVLDWELAFAGPPLVDLSILLRWADRWPPAFEQGMVAGFTAAGGALPADWKRTIRVLNLVTLVGFLRAPGAGDAAVVRDVVGLIGRTMHEWATYD